MQIINMNRTLLKLCLVLFLGACDSQPDASYINSDEQFLQACTYCKPCSAASRPLGCVDEGTHCVALCSSDQVWMTGFKGGLKGCRCDGTNDMWVFDQKTKVVDLRTVPLDEYGNEVD